MLVMSEVVDGAEDKLAYITRLVNPANIAQLVSPGMNGGRKRKDLGEVP